MATIKSFSDISQSKKLAEILPLESADMCYLPTHIGNEHHFIASLSPYSMCTKMTDVSIEYCTPCWSLSALFGVLLNGTNIIKDEADTENEKYMCTVGVKNDILSTFSDNPVDACVAMIEKLHELKML